MQGELTGSDLSDVVGVVGSLGGGIAVASSVL